MNDSDSRDAIKPRDHTDERTESTSSIIVRFTNTGNPLNDDKKRAAIKKALLAVIADLPGRFGPDGGTPPPPIQWSQTVWGEVTEPPPQS
jgi:hypothetical protein